MIPAKGAVDAHCHVDLYPNPEEVVRCAEARAIRTIAVTNAPSVFWFTRRITAGCRYVRPAAGLHPELVPTHGHELSALWPLLEETRYVGEIGLDYSRHVRGDRAKQRTVFAAIVQRCAELGGRVLTVHSRRAASDVLAILSERELNRVILHWFSGTLSQMERAAEAGCYFSVNGAMLASERGRTLVSRMPRGRVLTETDGPFTRFGPRAAAPPDAEATIKKLARLWSVSTVEGIAVVVGNLRAVVSREGRPFPL